MCCGRDVLTGALSSLITEEDEDGEEGPPACMVIALLLSSATLIRCDASSAEATTSVAVGAAAVGAEIRALARVSSNCALRWDRNSARFWLM
jgi:hypothetical protein